MTISKHRKRFTRNVSLAAAAVFMAACNRDKILTVTDPDIINPTDVASAEAAEALRVGALSRLNDATAGFNSSIGGGSLAEGLYIFTGVLADEWKSTDTFVQRDEIDSRAQTDANTAVRSQATELARLRVQSMLAVPVLRKFKPTSISDVGQMFWARGWAEMTIAENFCNGFPVPDLDGIDATTTLPLGNPETNVQTYTRAMKSFDSATTNVVAGAARGDTVKWMSAIEKARVQLDLGDVAGAGTTINAGAVPDAFKFTMFYSASSPGPDNQIWALNNSAGRWMVANNEGPLGLNPLTANDPRVPVCINTAGTLPGAVCRNFDTGTSTNNRTVSFDNNFTAGSFIMQLVWPNRDADVAIVTGTEARLIEAEVALRTGDVATFLAKLNLLRANYNTFKQPTDPCPATGANVTGCPTVPAGGNLLPPLTDPGTQTAREDLLFRERAFWLWSTAHRLADMRRMVRPTSAGGFGRAENSVFPNGAYYKGGLYGTDKFLIVPIAEANNPASHGCLDRNP